MLIMESKERGWPEQMSRNETDIVKGKPKFKVVSWEVQMTGIPFHNRKISVAFEVL